MTDDKWEMEVRREEMKDRRCKLTDDRWLKEDVGHDEVIGDQRNVISAKACTSSPPTPSERDRG